MTEKNVSEDKKDLGKEDGVAKEKKRKIPVKLIFIALVVTVLLCFCSVTLLLAVSVVKQVGSGNVISEERSVNTFSEIKLEGGKLNLFIEQGSTQKLEIEGEDNVLERLSTKVKGETLEIYYKRNLPFNLINLNFLHKDVNIYVTVKDLDAIFIEGSANVETENQLVLDTFKLQIEGSGTVDMDLRAFEVDTLINGTGDVVYKGSVNTQTLEINGSADYKAKDLESEFANVEINGLGDVEVNAMLKLDVDITGSGEVRYVGSPKVTQSISGSGSVEEL